MQSPSCSSSVSLFFSYLIRPYATIIWYTKPYRKPYQSSMLSTYTQILISCWSNTMPIKKLSFFTPRLFFALLFSLTCLSIQPSLQPQSKICSPALAICYLPSPPLLAHKIIPPIPTNTPFLYTIVITTIYVKSIFLYRSHLPNSGCVKGLKSKGDFWGLTLFQPTLDALSLLPQSIDRNNRAHHQWFLIANKLW